MNRLLAAILAGVAVAAGSCSTGTTLLAPPAGVELSLDSLLTSAQLRTAATAPVVSIIHTMPSGTGVHPFLEILPVRHGKLPLWPPNPLSTATTGFPKQGLYVGVVSFDTNEVFYLARVADPRQIRGERFDPNGAAINVETSRGTYSARVPFVASSIAVGFEVNGAGKVSSIQYYLKFGSSPPSSRGLEF
jgi:hypothetical protein